MRGQFALVALLLALLTPRAALAALVIEAAPLLGAGSPAVDGWLAVAVRLHNVGDAPIEGSLELVSELPWSSDRTRNVTRAPFAVQGKSSVALELPTRGFNGAPPSLSLRALGADGSTLGEVDVLDPHPHGPLLFDLSVPSRIAPTLRSQLIAIEPAGYGRGGYSAPTLAVAGPQLNPATGDPVLPERAAGYASVTLVLAKSEELARLSGSALEALGLWVLSGGALGVVVSRPEDLRGALLKTLVGGEIHETEPAPELRAPAEFWVAQEPSRSVPHTTPFGAPVPPPLYPPSGSSVRRLIAPTPEVRDKLVGYAGGNLHPSRWGSSASYGLGEVHLFAFDTAREPFLGDPWIKLEMLDLMRHAWQRQNSVAMPHAQTALDLPQLSQIRRQLDPNEATRWTIAVSALLLLAYSVFAGPINFYLAARKGRPLRAMLHLPIYAGAALVSVVVLGAIGKGVEGRARRLTLVEAGAGLPRAAATRFRGFYASSADNLTVRASDRASVLDVAGESDDTERVLVVDRDGARLERFRAKPWQTVVVREDGFITLGAGVSIVKAPGGDAEIRNRLARDLIGVIVKLPGHDAVFFDRIRDGESVVATRGETLPSSVGRLLPGHGPFHRLGSDGFAKKLDEAAQGLGAAWQAVEGVAPSSDWWSDDVPVLIGQIDGGEGRTADSGLRVDIDRVLLRVVGWGGLR